MIWLVIFRCRVNLRYIHYSPKKLLLIVGAKLWPRTESLILAWGKKKGAAGKLKGVA